MSITKTDGRGKHPNSRKNLIPAGPGDVRNPTGKSGPHTRTRIRYWLELMQEYQVIPDKNGNKKRVKMRNPVTGEEQAMSMKDLILYAQLAKATKGDTRAAEFLLDRLDGKPGQPITGPDGESLFGGATAEDVDRKIAEMQAKFEAKKARK